MLRRRFGEAMWSVRKRRVAMVAALAIVAAEGCGEVAGLLGIPTATMKGVINEQKIDMRSALAIEASEFFPSAGKNALLIVITEDWPISCLEIVGLKYKKKKSYMTLVVARTNEKGSWAVVDQGEYRIGGLASLLTGKKPGDGKRAAGVQLWRNNSKDEFVAVGSPGGVLPSDRNIFERRGNATFGAVTIDGVADSEDGSIHGSVELLFGTEKLAGTFSAPLCDLESLVAAEPVPTE